MIGMPAPAATQPEVERRRYPRRRVRLPITITAGTGITQPLECDTEDVSVCGVRLRAPRPVGLGACHLVIEDDGLQFGLGGVVVGETLDLESGEWIVRIDLGVDHAWNPERAAAAASATSGRSRSRTKAALIAALAAVAGLTAVAVWSGSSGDDDAQAVLRSGTESAPTTAAERAESGSESEVASAGSGSEPAASDGIAPAPADGAPTADPAASPTATAAPATPPTTAAPPPPAPTTVHRSESADHTTRVVLEEDGEVMVISGVGPSNGVDDLRIQLHVTPEANGTVVPGAVTIENRSTNRFTFEDGLVATITLARADGTTWAVTFTSPDITEVAPGSVVETSGSLDLGAPGSYDLSVLVEIVETTSEG